MNDTINAISVMERARRVRVAAFDVDGILTDGRLYYTDSGEEIKAFNAQDGHGIKMLRDSGVIVAIITSRTSRVVERRAHDLGIEHLDFTDNRAVEQRFPQYREFDRGGSEQWYGTSPSVLTISTSSML